MKTNTYTPPESYWKELRKYEKAIAKIASGDFGSKENNTLTTQLHTVWHTDFSEDRGIAIYSAIHMPRLFALRAAHLSLMSGIMVDDSVAIVEKEYSLNLGLGHRVVEVHEYFTDPRDPDYSLKTVMDAFKEESKHGLTAPNIEEYEKLLHEMERGASGDFAFKL